MEKYLGNASGMRLTEIVIICDSEFGETHFGIQRHNLRKNDF